MNKKIVYSPTLAHKMDKDHKGSEGHSPMKKRKLNYTIHNPNTVDETAKMLLDVLIQANRPKVERRLQELNHTMTEQRDVEIA